MTTQLHSSTANLEASADTEIPLKSWEKIVSATDLMARQLFPSAVVQLKLVSTSEIRRLNLSFRGVDRATDVLSFPAGGELHTHAGDIALCWDICQRQAASNGHPPEMEAVALTAHGLLHLAGLEHDDEPARRAMDLRTLELCRSAGYEVQGFGH